MSTEKTKVERGMRQDATYQPTKTDKAFEASSAASDSGIAKEIEKEIATGGQDDDHGQPTASHGEGKNGRDTAVSDEHEKDIERSAGTGNTASSEELYSVFSKRTKLFILIMATFAGFFSPFSTSIYFPALNPLAKHFNVSTNLINLTITTYMIFQGVAPMMYADFADEAGRRPAFFATFVVYMAANIGLAVQNSYAALLVLRCLQSAGSSGTVALTRGVLADVASPAERGSYMGWSSSVMVFAPAIAPIFGGLLTEHLGWRSIFWLLVIMAGIFMLLYVLFVPETNRKIVGNGSIPPTAWLNKSGWDLLKTLFRRDEAKRRHVASTANLPKRKLKWPRPWKTLVVLVEKDVAIILLSFSIIYAAFYAVMATIPTLFAPIYGLNETQTGLSYLPLGIGTCVAAIVSGKAVDASYARVARANNFPVDRKRGQDLRNFPIEKARLQLTLPLLAPGLLAILCYGWALQYSSSKAAMAGPLVLQFIMGFSVVAASNGLSTLMVDLYPEAPATVTASSNFTRCLLGAGATAVINPMVQAMGLGWTYTFWSLVCFLASALLLIEIKKGPQWREERRVRFERKRQKKQERAQREGDAICSTEPKS